MRFANPWGLALAALALPILALHVLRPSRDVLEVSSTYLWRSLARPVSASRPWERLRWSWLLAAQLMAVTLLAIAAARPVVLTSSPLAEHTVFIVDASGSMAAIDGDPDRLESAKRRAIELREDLPERGSASVVVASAEPRVVLTSSDDDAAFVRAIQSIDATAGIADFASAFSLAESLETTANDIGFVLLSDGGLTEAERRLLPPGTAYQPIGVSATNRAITRLSAEPRNDGLFARLTVANTGGPGAVQTLRIDVDGRTVHETELDLGPGRTVDYETPLPPGDRIEAFLVGEDVLAADDHAFAVAPQRRALRVAHVGDSNPFLERLFTVLEPSGVEVIDVASGREVDPNVDMVIYDQVTVPDELVAPTLAIAPPGGMRSVRVTGTVDNPSVVLVEGSDTLVIDLDLSEVFITEAQELEPVGAVTVIGSETTPLLVRGTENGHRFAYLGFAVEQSDLPLQIAFPILVDRLITELSGATQPPANLPAGRALPLDAGVTTQVRMPGGAILEVPAGAPAPVADRTGFWELDVEGRSTQLVAVNAPVRESTVNPELSLPTELRRQVDGERPPAGERSITVWFVVPILALIGVEWLLSRRRRGVGNRQWRWANLARVGAVVALAGSLFGLAITRPANRVATVFLIDGSDSLGRAGQIEAVGWVREALADRPGSGAAGVVLFGGDARLEQTVRKDVTLGEPAVQFDSTRTDIATALRLGGAVLPSDARRRIVLVSDGRATQGDELAEARRLRLAGIEVDVHTVTGRQGADVALARIDVPGSSRAGETVTVEATVSSTEATMATVALYADDELVDEQFASLSVGTSTLSFDHVPSSSGVVRYRVEVDASTDAIAENDTAFAAVRVDGDARILVAEGAAGEGETIARALAASGVVVEVADATQLQPIDKLTTFEATVLVNVDRRQLADEQVAALAAATRDLGHGLVVVGGTTSYGPGGYLGSDLEALLPLISEITDPLRRQSVAEVLAIDTSGSMGACHCNEGANGLGGGNRIDGGINKTDISRSSAARTIAALGDNDEVGVLAFDTEERWVIDLQKLPAEELVNEGLRSLSPDGETDISDTLEVAATALRQSNANLKHIIVFTDGFVVEGAMAQAVRDAERLAAEGITVSVIATGETVATDQLEAIADAGRGRFFPGTDLQRVPQIIVDEAVAASREFIVEGRFQPQITGRAPAVDNLDSTPPLLGYVASTEKPTARVLMRVGEERDPLLATWQLGLGTATAWTSDAGDQWGRLWADWDGYVDFWSAVVRDTFPAGDSSGAVKATIEDGLISIRVDGAEDWPDGADAVARVASPDLSGTEVRLERLSDTSFGAELAIGDAGTYAVGAVVRDTSTVLLSATTLANQSYSAEYQPGEPDAARLARVSDATGGRGEIEPAAAFDADGLDSGRSRTDLAQPLVLLAAALFLAAVILSRLRLRRPQPTGRTPPTSSRLREPRVPVTTTGTSTTGTAGSADAPGAASRPGRGSPPSPAVTRDDGPTRGGRAPDPGPDLPPGTSDTVARLLRRKRGLPEDPLAPGSERPGPPAPPDRTG